MNKNNLHSAFTVVDEISQLHNVLEAYTLQNVNSMENMEWRDFGLYFHPPHLSSLMLFCENIQKSHQAEDSIARKTVLSSSNWYRLNVFFKVITSIDSQKSKSYDDFIHEVLQLLHPY